MAARLSARAASRSNCGNARPRRAAKAAFVKVKGGCRGVTLARLPAPTTGPQEHLSRGVPLCGPPALAFPACFCCAVLPCALRPAARRKRRRPLRPERSSVHGSRRAGRHRRVARLHRARRDRQGLRLGDAVRGRHRLQGQRQDRRHLGRDGLADEPGRLRPRDRLGRRVAAPDPRRHGAAGRRLERVPALRQPSIRACKEAPWHFVDGKHYGVPYQWGPNVLMYNTNVFKKAPTSWSVVFEPQKLPDGKPNKGRVQAYDGPIYIADAALYLDDEEAGPRHQGSVRAQRAAVRRGARRAAQAASADPALLARRERAGAGLDRTRASSPRARGRSR